MYRSVLSICVLFLFFGLVYCSSNNQESDHSGVTNEHGSQPQIQQQESTIPYNFRLEMESLLDHYFKLKEAVTESDMQAAATASGELSAFTSSVLDEVLGAENQGLWLGIARIIRTETDKLIDSESPEEMRIYFEHISGTMIRVADSFDPAGGPYYLMECGEAATGDNQWLSRDEQIRNPYRTSADISCGEIVERFTN
ncbi:MAG TPA: DUF3347 domain-containing protein [Balneolaceae bacterium]|nr:DUF3347 domain-containing protein [Balneolaceae bacterium]